MAKVNVNTATREELVDVAGLRPDVADEILKFRRKGKITSVETLDAVPGVGPATLEQLRKALDFSDQSKNGGNGAKDATDNVAELGKRTADQAADVTREAAGRAEDVARRGIQVIQRTAGAVSEVQREVAHRSAEGTAELGQALIDLVNEQTRHNLETWTALTNTVDWDRVAKAVDWDRVFQLQGELLRASMERAAQLTQRYFEVTQAVMASAADAAKDQARKAA